MTGIDRVSRWTAGVLMLVGLAALGYAVFVAVDAKTYQLIEQHRFEQTRPTEPDLALVEGGPIGELRIPRLGLTAVVAQGDSASVLRHAVGHVADTALPGESGNVVLAGHRDTFFRPLKRVRSGDAIVVNTRHGDFEYVVESTAVVPPTDTDVLQATDRQTLTLITCFPFSYVGPAPDRFIVRARQTARSR
jgi:sortase A